MTKEDGLKMKRLFALILAAVMVFAFAACGEKTEGNNVQQQNTASGSAGSDSTAAPAAENAPSAAEPQQADATGGISPAKDGTLTISKADVAVVVNGTSVPVPYNLKEMEAAGVPADESRSEIKLGAGDFFSLNLYLDENEDYLLIPAYYNGGDSPISVYEAEAEEVTLTRAYPFSAFLSEWPGKMSKNCWANRTMTPATTWSGISRCQRWLMPEHSPCMLPVTMTKPAFHR